MRHTIGGLAALLLGHGMLTSLLSIRGNLEGFGTELIGGIGTAYYLGFFSWCVLLPPVMRRVGHIRMFSASAALSAPGSSAIGPPHPPRVGRHTAPHRGSAGGGRQCPA